MSLAPRPGMKPTCNHSTSSTRSWIVGAALASGLGIARPACAQEANCPAGQSISPDTAGHCCWPAQAWSTTRSACVGTPECPAGMSAYADLCASTCPAGQTVTTDTSGHCCWPGQVWSNARQTCVGIPQCGPGAVAQGEACVPATATPSPASVEPPPAPAPVGTRSRWEARGSGDRYDIDLVGPAGQRFACTTPCEIHLPMAVYHVHVHGSASFDGTFNVDSANAFGVRVRHANRGVLWGGRGIILGGIVLFATTEIINYAETGSVYTFNTLGVLSIVGLGLALVGAIMVQASGSDGFEAGPLRGAGQLDRVRRHAVGPHFRGVSLAASPAPSPYRGAQFFAAGAFTF